ncbi:hypothetical protein PNP85_02150 [Halobacterium salinarum]|uniref:hypothetical protein n=1 Tax=Halobacterium TaxID=2239 RepID=UPI001F17A201|nr:hypothetical protein [Halobacterium salinarum]MCF2165528.1 hypothetical protein [Halobacterium salinarum]MCF2168697.1 hypothetical protein [Halobacterium salinarum]MDL0121731.1 hypothetical protein [Halobacterium salinarum]MDL0124890.1 hypothetical protein [Halobacterium salinarum]MDL0136578.1 hypothetical protein [Halobacterium salinarum]
MPLKQTGRADAITEIDRFEGGVGWIAYPEETMQRASHALAVPSTDDEDAEADVWVIDPVDGDGVDELLAELGTVTGVVVLMDRHARDAEAVADRHDVPIYVPSYVDPEIDAPTQPITGSLPGTDFELVRTVDWPIWDEAALYDGETLVVGDLVGTVDYFLTGREHVGVHPMLRIAPPSPLTDFTPDRILTGHGDGIMQAAARDLEYAADGARRRAPKAWLNSLSSMLS